MLLLISLVYLINIVLLTLVFELLPFCPSESIVIVAGQKWCNSFVWISTVIGSIELFIISLCFYMAYRYKIGIIRGCLLATPPTILLFYNQYISTYQALDIIGVRVAEKIEYYNQVEIYIANGAIVILVAATIIFWHYKIKKKEIIQKN